jgi:predicted ATP-dependent serine protease
MNKGFYMLEKNGSVIVATSVDTDQTFEIKADHNKFSKIESYMAQGKLLSVTAKGTWSGRKDYEGFYNQTAKSNAPVEVKLTKLNDLNFSDDLFKPIKTGTPVDKLLSTDGGFMPGTAIFAAGAPGVGKCVRGNTLIKIRNKKTGQVAQMAIKEFHELAR